MKCSKVSFLRNKSKIPFNYIIDNNTLPEHDVIKDLGITFQANLQFSTHIDQISLKAIKTLGFLYRCTKSFDDIHCLKVLFSSLVRPILEYGSIIWNPTTSSHIQQLERVQRKFIRFIGFKRNLTYDMDNTSMQSLQLNLKLDPLLTRRNMLDTSFLFKLLNGIISCPPLLDRISFNVPQYNTRSCLTFHVKLHRTNYGKNNPLNRILTSGNTSNIDFFFDNLSNLKRHYLNC